MYILHVIDSAGLYGAEAVLLNLANEQQRQGHTPIILSIGNRHAETKTLEVTASDQGLRCIPLRMRDGLNLVGALRIMQVAEREHADLIHSHGYKTNILLGSMPKALRLIPIVTTLHGWTAKKTWSKLGVYRFLDQLLLHRLDAIVAVSELLAKNPAVTATGNRLHTIPNGIDLEDSLPISGGDHLLRDITALKSKVRILIGAVGRFSPEKNFGMLIEAMQQPFADQHDIGLVLFGDGPQAESLRQSAQAFGLQHRVLFGGYIPNARRYLGALDALVIPSLTEGLPMILLEAMAANLPIVATKVGEIPKVLSGVGTLVNVGDIDALRTALANLAEYLAIHKSRAAAGRERVEANYSARTMANSYGAVYRSVLGDDK